MARRNSNGEGSIYRRKDGRWVGSYWAQTTSGKTKRVYVYGVTRAMVHEKLTEIKSRDAQGISTADTRWKLGDYLDYWLEDVVKPNRRPSTYAQCETTVRLYLKPGLGSQDMRRLSVSTVQAFLNDLRIAGHSVSQMHVSRKVLSAALTRAQREELVARNVARLVELPPEQHKEVEPWRAGEIATFLREVRSDTLFAAYLLLTLYGLRRGELLGLRWQDIDVPRRELRIRQQLVRVGNQLHIGPLKTQMSRRDLPLITPVLQALQEHYEEQAGREIKSDLVFTTSSGNPIEPRNLTRSFERFCKRHSLRPIRLHDLRHTQATMLMRLSVPPRTVQMLLGHSRITTTQEIYQHSDDSAKREALELAEQHLMISTTEEVAPVDNPRSLAPFIDSNGSCQNRCQTRKNPTGWLGSISGASTGTLTLDLFHGKRNRISVTSRITEVDAVLNVRRRQLLLGIVAVNLDVKISHS